MTNFLLCYYFINFSIGIQPIRKKYHCLVFAVEWASLLHFQVSGEQCFVIAEPWIRGATAEVQSYGNELFESNIREEKLGNQSVWKHFGLDGHSCFEIVCPRFLFVIPFGNDFSGGEAGQLWISTDQGCAPSPPLDVSSGHIPQVLSSNKCSLATYYSNPDLSGCRTCRITAVSKGTQPSLPEPHTAVPGCFRSASQDDTLVCPQTHATEGKQKE